MIPTLSCILRDTAHPDSFGTLIDERCERMIPCVAGQPNAYLPDGRPASKVTVFGVPGDHVLDAAATLAPLGSIASRDKTVVYIDQKLYKEALCHLHRELIEMHMHK